MVFATLTYINGVDDWDTIGLLWYSWIGETGPILHLRVIILHSWHFVGSVYINGRENQDMECPSSKSLLSPWRNRGESLTPRAAAGG